MKKIVYETGWGDDFFQDSNTPAGFQNLEHAGRLEDGTAVCIVYAVPEASMRRDDGSFDDDAGDYDYTRFDVRDPETYHVIGTQDDFQILPG